MKKIFCANGNQKKAGIAILISNKIKFKTNIAIRNKKGHYIMIYGSVQQKDVTFVSICVPKYIKQI